MAVEAVTSTPNLVIIDMSIYSVQELNEVANVTSASTSMEYLKL